MAGIFACAGFTIYTISYSVRDVPDYKVLKNYFLSETDEQKFKPIYDLPDQVKFTFIAAENPDFYKRDTPDFIDVIANFLIPGNTSKNKPTITYYVARQALSGNNTYINPIERSIREIVLSVRLEKVLSKDQILALYLNHVYLGDRCFGIYDAAFHYFDKSPEELNLPEAAYLAGIIKSPNRYAAEKDLQAAKERRDYVIGLMADEEYITASQATSAMGEPLHISPTPGACPSRPHHDSEILVQPQRIRPFPRHNPVR